MMERNRPPHSIGYNFVMNFILSASQFLFPLITFPYISRVLLAEGSGKVTFASSVASYFLMAASLGIPTYGIRACAQVRNDRTQLSRTAQEIFFINVITTVLSTLAFLGCIFCVPRLQSDRTLFLLHAASLLLNELGVNWLFQALEQYDYITMRTLAFKVLCVVLMFFLVKDRDDYVIYAGISIFASIASNLLAFFHARTYVDFSWKGNYHFRRHLKPIFVLFAQSLAVSIYTNLDTVMLGFMKADVEVGYYNAAVKVKTVLVSLVTSLGAVLLPRMSFYVKETREQDFLDAMTMGLNVTLLMALPLTTYFTLYASESIRFLAGEGYAGAVLAMQLITPAVIPIGITVILGIQVLTALEKESIVLFSVIVGALVDLGLNLALIPAWGAAGAALATTLAETSVLVVQVIFTWNLLRKIASGLRWHRYLLILLPGFLAACGFKLLPIASLFWKLAFSASAFFGFYAVGLLLLKEPIALQLLDMLLQQLRKLKKKT